MGTKLPRGAVIAHEPIPPPEKEPMTTGAPNRGRRGRSSSATQMQGPRQTFPFTAALPGSRVAVRSTHESHGGIAHPMRDPTSQEIP